jgi:hypothetical protein
MRLSHFISAHIDEIVAEWVSFARTLDAQVGGMSTLTLQDHAKPILQAIALDIETSQNASHPWTRWPAPHPCTARCASSMTFR